MSAPPPTEPRAAPIRRILFETDTIELGAFSTRPLSDACGDVERQDRDVVVLPFHGVFAKHESPGRHVLGTPAHAVLVARDTPYRIGFPGAIGDHALTLRPADPALVCGQGARASHGLLSAETMLLRESLRARLERGALDDLETESLTLRLLDLALRALRTEPPARRRATHARRAAAIARVKEAVALAPADKWSVAELARVANLSPFHLCHVFREMVGTSIHDYVVRERLAWALNAVLDGRDDITSIALDAGFSSHSHFTARFRAFFGRAPAVLRCTATRRHLGEMRKIVTAPRRQMVFD